MTPRSWIFVIYSWGFCPGAFVLSLSLPLSVSCSYTCLWFLTLEACLHHWIIIMIKKKIPFKNNNSRFLPQNFDLTQTWKFFCQKLNGLVLTQHPSVQFWTLRPLSCTMRVHPVTHKALLFDTHHWMHCSQLRVQFPLQGFFNSRSWGSNRQPSSWYLTLNF